MEKLRKSSLLAMDLEEFFATAGSLLWRHRFLWLFGLISVAGATLIDMLGRLWLRPGLVSWLADPTSPTLPGPAGIIIFLFLIVFFGLLIWLLNVIAEGGLIFAVSEMDAGRAIAAGDIRRAIRRTLVPFVAADTLLFLPLFIMTLLVILGGAALFVTFILGVDNGALDIEQGISLLAGGFLACLLPLSCLAIPVLLVTLVVRLFVFRAIAIDRAGARDGIRRAVQFVRRRPGNVILIFLILWVIRFLANTITGVLTGPLEFAALRPLLPLLSGGTVTVLETSPVALAGGIFISLLSLLAGSLLFAYAGAVWTLFYQRGKET